MSGSPPQRSWTEFLEDEELVFLKRFVLAGGSLKDLATVYSVSYPTVRLRLDRLIARLQIFDSQTVTDEFERVLRAQFAGGKFDAATFKRLLTAYQQGTPPPPKNLHETPPQTRTA